MPAADGLDDEIYANAGAGWQSGDGPPAMPQVLATAPDVVVLALGGNDGLRRADTGTMERHHPNRDGALQAACNVWPTVAELVRTIDRRRR